MHKDRDITGHFMHMTGRLRPLLGPADHGDLAILVLHRHDSDEDESDKQLAAFNIRSDSGGCHYALRKLTGSDSPDAE